MSEKNLVVYSLGGMMKKILAMTLLTVVTLSWAVAYRDIVYLKDGEEIKGSVVKISKKSVLVKTSEGEKEFPLGDVVRISFTRPRPGDDWEDISQVNDTLLLRVIKNAPDISQFPRSSWITLYRSTRFSFDHTGKGTRTEREIVLVLNERGKLSQSVSDIGYLRDWQSGDFDFVRTIAPDGKLFHIDDAAIQYGEPDQWYIQYNVAKSVRTAAGRVEVGSVIDRQYHINYNEVDPLHPVGERVVFGEREPVLEQELIVEVSKSLGDKFFRFTTHRFPGNGEKKELPDKIVYHWKLTNLPPNISEDWMPPLEMILPVVSVSFGADGAELKRQLANAVKHSLSNASPGVDKFCDSLLVGKNTQEQKFYSIYQFLNISFRKAPVWPASCRWTPRTIKDIWETSVANPLDLAVLGLYMLGRAKINSRVLYCSSQSSEGDGRELENLAFFGSILLEAEVDGKRIYCSPFDKYSQPMIPGELQGCDAIAVGWGSVDFIKIPLNPPDVFTDVETLWIELAPNGDANVRYRKVYSPSTSSMVKSLVEKKKEELDKELETSAGSIHPGTRLISYSISGIKTLDSVASVERTVFCPQLAIIAGKSMMALHPLGLEYTTAAAGLPVRNYPLYFTDWKDWRRVWVISLPKGFSVRNLPENLNFATDSLGFSIEYNYDKKNNRITVSERDFLFDSWVPAQEYPDTYRRRVFVRAETKKHWIVLEGKGK